MHIHQLFVLFSFILLGFQANLSGNWIYTTLQQSITREYRGEIEECNVLHTWSPMDQTFPYLSIIQHTCRSKKRTDCSVLTSDHLDHFQLSVSPVVQSEHNGTKDKRHYPPKGYFRVAAFGINTARSDVCNPPILRQWLQLYKEREDIK